MAENLQYFFDESGIGIDVPYDIFHRAALGDMDFIDAIKLPPSQKVLDIDESGKGIRLRPRLKRIGAIQDHVKKSTRIKQVARVISGVSVSTPTERQDPMLNVYMSTHRLQDGTRLPMYAEVKRSTEDNIIMGQIATDSMRRTARELKYCGGDILDSMVYAQVDDNGVTLETNPLASSSLDTDGSDYDNDSETIKVYAHNLYSHEMQLICLTGLIRLAHP